MKILVAKKVIPVELTLIVNGCCYEIKDAITGYDTSGFRPGSTIPLSKLPPRLERKLVVEDDLGIEYWFDPDAYTVVAFEPKIYQTLKKDPLRYIVEGDQLIENPDWREPMVVIPDDVPEAGQIPGLFDDKHKDHHNE